MMNGGIWLVEPAVDDGLGGIVADVAHKRATKGHVHDLHAAADAQHRHVGVPACAHERPLKGVARGAGERNRGMALWCVGVASKGAVGNVAAAREENAVKTSHYIGDQAGCVKAKGDSEGEGHRDATRICHRGSVVVIRHGPVWVLGVLPGPRRDADERPGGCDCHVSSPVQRPGGYLSRPESAQPVWVANTEKTNVRSETASTRRTR